MIDERFRKAEEEYLLLKGELDAGRVTAEGFEKALEAAMIEHDGRWWMLGANSGNWYVYDGGAWAETRPPEARAGTAPAERGLGTLAERGDTALEPASSSPSSSAPSVSRRSPVGALQVALRSLLGLSVTLAGLGTVLTARVVSSGYFADRAQSELATTLLVGAAFCLGLCLPALRPTLPRLPLVLATVAWTLVGFFGIQSGLGLGSDFWWWADILFASGLAGLVGGFLGFRLSRRLHRAVPRSSW